MDREKVLKFLEKFNYNYVEQGDKVKVNLDFSHQIIIDFTNSNKVVIKDKLKAWNFLTGMIQMSLKNAMIYNFLGTIVIGIFFLFENMQSTKINFVGIFLIFITWILLFTFYYLIRSESFKEQIINLIKE